jgi:DNA-binding IclR family transcriptional regulator
MSEKKDNGVIPKVFKILSAFIDESDQWGVRDLASHLDLPISTLHRFLKSLQDQGMLEYNPDTRKYQIGMELYRIGSVLSTKFDFKKIAQPFLKSFVNKFDETICLVLYHKKYKKVMFLDQVVGSSPFQYVINIGDLQPVPYGSSGKSIMAYLDREEVEQILNLESFDTHQKNKIIKELKEIREEGAAFSFGERVEGARGIAAPIFDSSKSPIGSVIFASPIKDLDEKYEKELSQEIQDIALKISKQLGYAEE